MFILKEKDTRLEGLLRRVAIIERYDPHGDKKTYEICIKRGAYAARWSTYRVYETFEAASAVFDRF